MYRGYIRALYGDAVTFIGACLPRKYLQSFGSYNRSEWLIIYKGSESVILDWLRGGCA
jgi:hypothetical protein